MKKYKILIIIFIISLVALQKCSFLDSKERIKIISQELLYDSLFKNKKRFDVSLFTTIDFNPKNVYKYNYTNFLVIINKDTFPLISFGKNKNLYATNENTIDNSALSCEFYKKEYNRFKLYNIEYSKFNIKNDSIYTYDSILITVGAGQRIPVYCNFRGFVKNRDTITDWKVIPPYPKDFIKSVLKWNADLIEPHTLYFVKTDAVKCLQIE